MKVLEHRAEELPVGQYEGVNVDFFAEFDDDIVLGSITGCQHVFVFAVVEDAGGAFALFRSLEHGS